MSKIAYFKDLFSAPFIIPANLYRCRHILWQMIVREIKGRFAGSIGGLLWNFVHPVLMIGVYLFVFLYIFKLRVSSFSGQDMSAIYMMAGLFPWIIMSEGLLRGTSSLLENANLIQKTTIPAEILTAKAVLTPFLSYGVALLALMLYKVIIGGVVEALYKFPLAVALQIFFTLGIVFFTSAISVLFRDVIQLVHIVTNFWLFLTPILYSIPMLPEWAKKVMYINPLYPLVSIYQALFLQGSLGERHLLILTGLWALFFFIFGAITFYKLRDEFADWL